GPPPLSLPPDSVKPDAPKRAVIYWPAVLIAGGCTLLFVVSLTASVLITHRRVEPRPAATSTTVAGTPAKLVPKKMDLVRPVQPQVPKKEAREEKEIAEDDTEKADDPKDSGPPPCKTYGTSVDFVTSPKKAARWAEQEDKLLFVLHVSGNFED